MTELGHYQGSKVRVSIRGKISTQQMHSAETQVVRIIRENVHGSVSPNDPMRSLGANRDGVETYICAGKSDVMEKQRGKGCQEREEEREECGW